MLGHRTIRAVISLAGLRLIMMSFALVTRPIFEIFER